MCGSFGVRVQDGRVSVASDRTHIFNYMAGRRGAEFEAPPLAECKQYETTSEALRGLFVTQGYWVMFEKGDDMVGCFVALWASGVAKFVFAFDGCAALSDDAAARLWAALPPTLEELKVVGLATSGLMVAGRGAALEGVARSAVAPRLRRLYMSACGLTGRLPDALGACTALKILHLYNNQLSDKTLPEALRQRQAQPDAHRGRMLHVLL